MFLSIGIDCLVQIYLNLTIEDLCNIRLTHSDLKNAMFKIKPIENKNNMSTFNFRLLMANAISTSLNEEQNEFKRYFISIFFGNKMHIQRLFISRVFQSNQQQDILCDNKNTYIYVSKNHIGEIQNLDSNVVEIANIFDVSCGIRIPHKLSDKLFELLQKNLFEYSKKKILNTFQKTIIDQNWTSLYKLKKSNYTSKMCLNFIDSFINLCKKNHFEKNKKIDKINIIDIFINFFNSSNNTRDLSDIPHFDKLKEVIY